MSVQKWSIFILILTFDAVSKKLIKTIQDHEHEKESIAAVESLLAEGANVNYADILSNKTALMLAAEKGHTSTVNKLLEAGANVNIKDLNRGT